MDLGVFYGGNLSGDFVHVIICQRVFAFRELHLADIVGPLGGRWNDEVHLNPLAVGRRASPTERSAVFLDSERVGELWRMLHDEEFESVARPSIERLAPLHGTPRGEVGVLDKTEIEQGEEIDQLIDGLFPWAAVAGVTPDDAGVHQVFEHIGEGAAAFLPDRLEMVSISASLPITDDGFISMLIICCKDR